MISNRPAFPQSQPPPTRDYIPQQPSIQIQRVPSTSSRHQFRISTVSAGSADYSGIGQPSPGFDADEAEDEDGGFYDNIQNLNARAAADEAAGRQMPPPHGMVGARFGQQFHGGQTAPPQPPPHKFLQQQKGAGARIGQLIRKLGGVAERPVVQQTQQPYAHHLHVDRLASSGSVLSLNRVRLFKYII